MRPVSSRFVAAIRESHTVATLAQVLTTDGEVFPVPVLGGGVTLDQGAAVRGRCDVALSDDGTLNLVPRLASDPLAPYGNEIKLSRGIVYPDGEIELVALGVFRVQVTDVDDGPGGVEIRVTGLDRSQRIVDARFEEALTVDAAQNYADAILTIVQAAWPDVPHRITATAYTTPTLQAQVQGDRWAFVQEMATSIGMRLYFDGDGILVLEPDILTDPVESIAEGEGGVLLTGGRQWTREGTYNRAVVTGENTTETAISRGVATDDNPLSPTYYYGPFGKVPEFAASPFITSDAQAVDMARGMLGRKLGTTEQVRFGSFVLPYLEPGDTVHIQRGQVGINENHVLDGVTIPLGGDGVMSGQTRAREVIA